MIKKQNKINSSLDQWESDDPRKGGKIYLRKLINGNAIGIDTTYQSETLLRKSQNFNWGGMNQFYKCIQQIREKRFRSLSCFQTPLEPQHFFKGIRPKIQRKNLTFSFFEILLMKSCQNGFLRSHIKMSDKQGSFDTHIAIFHGIYVIWQMS